MIAQPSMRQMERIDIPSTSISRSLALRAVLGNGKTCVLGVGSDVRIGEATCRNPLQATAASGAKSELASRWPRCQTRAPMEARTEAKIAALSGQIAELASTVAELAGLLESIDKRVEALEKKWSLIETYANIQQVTDS